jgi:glutathione S-transferase
VSLTLHANDISGYCCKVRIVLAHKRVPHADVPPPDGYGSPAYRVIVPAGTIPGLVIADAAGIALALSESEAINEYLDEVFPEPPMLPGDAAARAVLRQLSRFHDARLEPPLRALFAHVAPAGREMRVVDAQLGLIEARISELAALARPGPLLGGRALTLADCGYPASFMLARGIFQAFGRVLVLPSVLAQYEAALAGHPSVAPALARCTVATKAWFRQKLGGAIVQPGADAASLR